MVNLMEQKYGARVVIAAIILLIGGSANGAIFIWLGLFLMGGAVLAILLDAFEQLLAGRRRSME
jgi:hypothetical protein